MRIISYVPEDTLPLTVEEVKKFLRITHSDDDTMLEDMIKRVTELIEELSGYTMRAVTIKIHLTNVVSQYVSLPFTPADSITEVIADDEDITTDVELKANEIAVLPGDTYDEVYITYTTTATTKSALKPILLQGIAMEYEHRDGLHAAARLLDMIKLVKKVRL